MTAINPDAERLIALLSGRAVATETIGEADWQRIVELAQKQGVAPILYARLKERGITPPLAIVTHLRQIYLANANRNSLLFHEIGKILHALQAANIPVIALKGACLAEAVYSNIALRSMGDVDLLVMPNDLAQALDVLRTLGYASEHPFEIEVERLGYHHLPQLSKPDSLAVEVHWTIAQPIYYRNHLQDDDLEQLWARAIPVKIRGIQVLMLSPTDLLLHLCLHASVHHRFGEIGLRSFWDMALVIRRYGDAIDWEQFTARAHRWGIVNGVYLALKLTEELTGIAIPTPLIHFLTSGTPDDAAIRWARHKIWNETSPTMKIYIGRFEGKARLADKLAVLFPPRALMSSIYHIPANSWRILAFYPVRLKDVWMRYSQVMWQLVWRDKTLTTEARQEAHLCEYLGWD